MEFFRCFLRVIGLLDDAKVDFISDLPPEVSHLILRKLDPKSLLCAAHVSHKWLSVCRADKSLRQTAMHHKQRAMRVLKERFAGEAQGDPTTVLHRHPPTPALVRRCVPFVPNKRGVDLKIPRNRMPSLGKVSSVTTRRSRCFRL